MNTKTALAFTCKKGINSNPTLNLGGLTLKYSDTDVKPEIISDVGFGVGVDFFKKTINFGIVNQELQTMFNSPPSAINRDTSSSSLTPTLISSSSADLNIKKGITIKYGEANMSSSEREAKLRAQEKIKDNRYEKQNKSQLEKKLEANVKASVNPNLKIDVPILDTTLEVTPKQVKSEYDFIKKQIDYFFDNNTFQSFIAFFTEKRQFVLQRNFKIN